MAPGIAAGLAAVTVARADPADSVDLAAARVETAADPVALGDGQVASEVSAGLADIPVVAVAHPAGHSVADPADLVDLAAIRAWASAVDRAAVGASQAVVAAQVACSDAARSFSEDADDS